MAEFTPLERAAIDAILDEMAKDRAILEQQLRYASVLSRKNTGGGFFTELKIASDGKELARNTEPLGQNVWVSVDGLEYGLGMILHLEDGMASLIEGYAVGPEDTSVINFEDVRFALAKEPGPFPPSSG